MKTDNRQKSNLGKFFDKTKRGLFNRFYSRFRKIS